jgi:hypothetical protein
MTGEGVEDLQPLSRDRSALQLLKLMHELGETMDLGHGQRG